MSDDDSYCEMLYQKTTFRNHNGRFVVSLPFRRDLNPENSLGNTRNAALSQYLRNEVRLSKMPQTKESYDNVLHEYISLGHMAEVCRCDEEDNTQAYYMPHHAIYKPDSTTT